VPNRSIRESARTSKTLAKLSGDEERLFWRLTTVADDFGRFIAEADVILGACFSRQLDHIKKSHVSKWLQALADVNLLEFYEKDGTRYGVFVTWEKHQGKPRALASKHPDPQTSVRICKQMSANVLVSESDSVSEKRIRSSVTEPAAQARFDEFWKAYPARDGKRLYKPKAISLFLALPETEQGLCLAAAKAYARHCQQTDARTPSCHRAARPARPTACAPRCHRAW